MEKNKYISILLQSLRKKKQILETIILLNQRQKNELEDPALDPDDFDKTVGEKSELIDELNRLDDGFNEVYNRVKDELSLNRDFYHDEIVEMQELIRLLTEKSASIKVQEARNKELMTQKFTAIKKQVKEVRASQKIVNQYYKSMMNTNFIDPQFTDSKK